MQISLQLIVAQTGYDQCPTRGRLLPVSVHRDPGIKVDFSPRPYQQLVARPEDVISGNRNLFHRAKVVGTSSNNRLPYTGSRCPVPSSANRSKSDLVVIGPSGHERNGCRFGERESRHFIQRRLCWRLLRSMRPNSTGEGFRTHGPGRFSWSA